MSEPAGETTDLTIDVILPCLNEEAALPWVLSRLPDGYRAITVLGHADDGEWWALGANLPSHAAAGHSGERLAAKYAATAHVSIVKGAAGLMFEADGNVAGVMGFTVATDRITEIDFVINPRNCAASLSTATPLSTAAPLPEESPGEHPT